MPFINIYEYGRNYGGAEEGGWFYDAWTIVASHRFHGKLDSDKSRKMLNRYRLQYGFTPSYDRQYQARWRGMRQGWFVNDNGRTERGDDTYSSLGRRASGSYEIRLESTKGANGDNYSPWC